MAEPLSSRPTISSVDTQGLSGTGRHEPDDEVLERVGFSPAYIEHPNAGWMARMPRLDVVQLPTVGFHAVVLQLPTGVTLCNAAEFTSKAPPKSPSARSSPCGVDRSSGPRHGRGHGVIGAVARCKRRAW